MLLRNFFPVVFWVVCIVFANFYLFSRTKASIAIYETSPPFRIFDATNSGGLNNLLDEDPNRVWEKKNPSLAEFDFFLEMKLSHFWNGTNFQPRNFSFLRFTPCPGKPLPKFKLRFLLRESINVDKELRMPEDKVALVYDFTPKNESLLRISLSALPKFKQETNYPQGIYILTPEITIAKDSKSDCFAEISLEESPELK